MYGEVGDLRPRGGHSCDVVIRDLDSCVKQRGLEELKLLEPQKRREGAAESAYDLRLGEDA